jgi:hypothetical protein
MTIGGPVRIIGANLIAGAIVLYDGVAGLITVDHSIWSLFCSAVAAIRRAWIGEPIAREAVRGEAVRGVAARETLWEYRSTSAGDGSEKDKRGNVHCKVGRLFVGR